MTQREKDLFYEVLELLRKEVRTSSDFRNRDWKDADDYIFSALHLTQGDRGKKIVSAQAAAPG